MIYELYDNNCLIKTTFIKEDSKLWGGKFSDVLLNGVIIKFVKEYLKNKNIILILLVSDGDIQNDIIKKILIENNCNNINKKIIIVTPAQFSESPNLNYLYLPQNDDFFKNSVQHYFNNKNLPKWEQRQSSVFWRGGCSGLGGTDSIRCLVVKELLDYKNADVKLLKYWKIGNIPNNYFGNKVDYKNFLNYKIFLIIDGAGISSSHMWGFGSGGVPFMISKAKYWFKNLLIPDYNYIEINYDLSNLIEKIEWVINNDEEAKKIAENALQLSNNIFNNEFQKKYLMKEIDRICD